MASPRDFTSLDEALEAMQSSSPAAGELGKAMSAAERQQYAAELEHRARAYVQSDGRCLLPGEALLGAGTNV